jgi:hypothetical protein
MDYLEGAALIVGFALLLIGYRKNNRNLLACATLAMLVAGGAVSGFVDGWNESTNASRPAVATL